MIAAGAGPIFRRELSAFFLSPVGSVVGACFLALQGLSFWALVRVLADPALAAPTGAVLSTFFGGTVVHWAILFALVSALTMRLFAEERASGTWESLCTTGVSDAAIIVGKIAAALTIYVALWTPTAAFVAVVQLFAPDGSGIELGPVLSAYVGVAVIGTAAVAIGAFCSALTDKQIVAALSSFAILMAGLLVGEVTSFGLGARAAMTDFAAGLLRPSAIVAFVALGVVFALLAYAAIGHGRRRRGEIVRRVALAAIVANAAIALCILAAHATSVDTTRARSHTLEPETVAVLARVDVPVDVVVIEPLVAGFADVFRAISAVVDRMIEAQPNIRRRVIDPASGGGELAELAREFGMAPEPLAQGGAVLFRSGARKRLLDVTAVASFADDPLGKGHLAGFWAESAFSQAIAEVVDSRLHVVCEAADLGGLPLTDTGPEGLDWATAAQLLRADGLILKRVNLEDIDDCSALLVVGPDRALTADEALSVSEAANRAIGILFAVRSASGEGASQSGLELILEPLGVQVSNSVVVDPDAEVGIANLWSSTSGYGDHPISRPFKRREIETAWPAPRAIGGDSKRAVALVMSSNRSWAESDQAAVFAGDKIEANRGERLGPVPVAVAVEASRKSGRLVVLGSAEASSSQFVGRGLGAGHILAARAIRWLVGRDVDIEVADKSPEHLRLIMSKTAVAVLFVVSVLAVPILWLAFFGALVWRRRV